MPWMDGAGARCHHNPALRPARLCDQQRRELPAPHSPLSPKRFCSSRHVLARSQKWRCEIDRRVTLAVFAAMRVQGRPTFATTHERSLRQALSPSRSGFFSCAWTTAAWFDNVARLSAKCWLQLRVRLGCAQHVRDSARMGHRSGRCRVSGGSDRRLSLSADRAARRCGGLSAYARDTPSPVLS
eukprot:3274762-Rhodomonas_salina.1